MYTMHDARALLLLGILLLLREHLSFMPVCVFEETIAVCSANLPCRVVSSAYQRAKGIALVLYSCKSLETCHVSYDGFLGSKLLYERRARRGPTKLPVCVLVCIIPGTVVTAVVGTRVSCDTRYLV